MSNNTFLNSYDPLSLPYQSGYGSGRPVTHLPEAAKVSGGLGDLYAVGFLGKVNGEDLVLLSMRRYRASNGDEESQYYVSIFTTGGEHKGSQAIGRVIRSAAGWTFAMVNFTASKSGSSYKFDIEQQFEEAKTKSSITISSSGSISKSN